MEIPHSASLPATDDNAATTRVTITIRTLDQHQQHARTFELDVIISCSLSSIVYKISIFEQRP